ncbi:MAG: ribonuclease HII, partial [Bradyrhizobium sp.]|nr:ribonuclease HII [Bradyrhizobium sp.]
MKRSARSTSLVRPKVVPTFDVEARAIASGEYPVAGVDEAGRGPWAGPVVAAAV